jgi:hypothetical protein
MDSQRFHDIPIVLATPSRLSRLIFETDATPRISIRFGVPTITALLSYEQPRPCELSTASVPEG